MKYLCEIRYDGTDFAGFQFQPGRRTVQGELTRAAAEVFGEACAVTGCSRTDSGVHAERFFLTVATKSGLLPVPPEKLPLAFNAHLGPDLVMCAARAAEDAFHPRYDAKGKKYKYLLRNAPVDDPFLRNRAWQLRRPFLPDALERMRLAASFIPGKKDFAAFMAAGSAVEDSVRDVFLCDVSRWGERYTVEVAADGFLYNMVRIIVGTLADVAYGAKRPEEIPGILASCDRKNAGRTAPPEGLYLAEVYYDEAERDQSLKK